MKTVTMKDAQQKAGVPQKRKKMEEIDVSSVEQKDGAW